MKISDYNNYIFIINDASKKYFLKLINDEKKLLNIKIITLKELKNKWYFSYDEKTVYYVAKKYSINSELAKIYLENLYYIDTKLDDDKIKLLYELKEELIEKKLIKENKLFRKFLENKNIVFYDLKFLDKFYTKLLNEIKNKANVVEVENQKIETRKDLFAAQDKIEELTFVASKVTELIKSGIDINKIFISNVQSNYFFALKNTFKKFNIPLEIDSKNLITGTIIYKKFIEFYDSDIEYTLTKLNEYVSTSSDEEIYKKILNAINKYSWTEDYNLVKTFIIEDLKNTTKKYKKYDNAVRIKEFLKEPILDDEYVFLINFNQGIIPTNYKDEDFLNDNLKNILNLSTSIDLNINAKLMVQHRIKQTKNLIVTYSKNDINNELYISNAYDKNLFIEKQIEISYNHSDDYNRQKLVCLKDENRKFGTVSKELIELNNHYKDEDYCSYDNQFKGIDRENLLKFLNNKLVLSYSSINNYYKCAFKYYVENILKLNKFEDTFEIIVGNIFHKVLSKCFDNNDLEKLWQESIDEEEHVFLPKEKFFLDILKKELFFIVETIKNQQKYSNLEKSFYEKKLQIKIKETPEIIFKGFIDKILYENIDDKTIVSIIDYKTGNPELNLDNTYYGIDMQLPVYAYLIKKSHLFKDPIIGGFYLQKILDNETNLKKKEESLKLQGYSNSDINILSKVDSSYKDSQVIKGMKISNNGFYKYTKILSNIEINNLVDLVEKNIIIAGEKIINGEFEINPKQIEDKNIGCNFCKYKDICFLNNVNIKKLKKVKKDDFLGGEKPNAEMDK